MVFEIFCGRRGSVAEHIRTTSASRDATVINHDELSLPKEWSENENEEGRQTEDQFRDAAVYYNAATERKMNFSLIFST